TTVVPVSVTAQGPALGIVTVAAQVNGTRWVYVDVTVATVGGKLVVPEPPALVPAPMKADTAPTLSPAHVDAGLPAALRPAVEAFFRAYASGSGADLAYFAPSGSAPMTGLSGAVALDAVTDLEVGEGGLERDGVAEVRWADHASGSALTQLYHLGLVQRDGR